MTDVIEFMPFDSAIAKLLIANDLPVEDLSDAKNVALFVCKRRNQLLGVIGLEGRGAEILLRSLAVAATGRRQGIGAALVAHAETFAAENGATAIYLLTTTADAFFRRHGYTIVDRSTAPAAIQTTRQFSTLCPSSSAFMTKVLPRDHRLTPENQSDAR